MIKGPIQTSAIDRGSRTEALTLREIIMGSMTDAGVQTLMTDAGVQTLILAMNHGIGIAGRVPIIILTILLLGIVPQYF
jgi:hypothetical protein